MRHSYLVKMLTIAVILILIWISAVAIDYHRATQRQKPFFTYSTIFQNDGGTSIFLGLGYRITFYNQTETPNGRMDTVFWFGVRNFGFERTFPRVTD